jgi:H+/Cl- antiporter ClcA
VPFRAGGDWHLWETVAVGLLAVVAVAFSVYIVYLLEIIKLANPRIRRREAERAARERMTA